MVANHFARFSQWMLVGSAVAFPTLLHAQLRPASPATKQNAPASAASPASQGQAPVAAANASSAIPSIVATVNGSPISKDQLGQECLVRYGDQVLESMFNKYVILQACQSQQIQVTQKDIDDEIARIAMTFNLNTKLYLQLIQDERNISPEQYSADIVWPMVALKALASDKIQVSQQELNQAFESEFGPTVKVRMILVTDPQKATQLHQQAKADPASFKRLAKEFSEDASSASVEGLLPPIRKNSGDDEVERAAFALKPDEISNVFNVGNTYLFLQCVRHDAGSRPSQDQIPAILNRIEQTVRADKLKAMAETMFTTLREQSSIVKVFGNATLEKQHPGVAAIINRQNVPLSQLADECIKRYGTQVLEGEMNRKLLETALAASQKQIVQSDIDSEIARAADYYGYINRDGTPNVEAWLKNVMDEDGATLQLYVRDAVWPTVALKKLVDGSVQVTEEDMRAGFETNYGPRVEVLAIVLSNQRTAQEVWQMARDNPTDQFFGELAAQYSIEPSSKSNYGKVPPVKKGGGQPTLEKMAFAMTKGELSKIVEVDSRYVILRCQGFTEPVVKDPNVVKDELYKDSLEKKTRKAMQVRLDQLMASAQIVNFLDPKKSKVSKTEKDESLNALKASQNQLRRD